jgi:hypothetical protein
MAACVRLSKQGLNATRFCEPSQTQQSLRSRHLNKINHEAEAAAPAQRRPGAFERDLDGPIAEHHVRADVCCRLAGGSEVLADGHAYLREQIGVNPIP